MKIIRIFIGLMSVCFISISVMGQKNIHLSDDVIYPYLYKNDSIGSELHTSIRPFRQKIAVQKKFESSEKKGIDYVQMDFGFKNKAREEVVNLSFTPIVTAVGGGDITGETFTYDLSFGLNSSLRISDKLFANFNLIENFNKYDSYTSAFVESSRLAPGVGHVTDEGDDTFSSNFNNGYISYSPDEHFNFQLGRGKQFIGEGYRSLILSDAAAPYDYFKVTTSFWKINYVNLFTRMKHFPTIDDMPDDFKEKYTTMHYLSWNVTKRLNIGLFEAVVWQSEDSLVSRGFDIYYLNPIIFYRPVEFSVGSPDNAFIGGLISYRISKSLKAYGQLMLDEFLLSEIRSSNGWWGNKQAAQLGLKYYNAFNVDRLTLLGEFNYIRPFTYGHLITSQNYGHYNQSLAHPYGANMREVNLIGNYFKNDWFIEGKLSLAEKGLNQNGNNSGGDIFISNNNRPENSDYGNNTTQGLLTNVVIGQLRISRQIGKINNIRLEAIVRYANASNDLKTRESLSVNIGVRSNLFNQQLDVIPQ